MKFNFIENINVASNAIIIPVFKENNILVNDLTCADTVNTLLENGQIKTALGEITPFFNGQQTLLFVGVNQADKLSENSFNKVISSLVAATKSQYEQLSITIEALIPVGRDLNWTIRQFSQQWVSNLYSYDTTKSKKASVIKIETMTFITQSNQQALADQGAAIGLGMNVTKELGNLPSNICTPTYLAQQCIELSDNSSNFSTEVLEESDMQALAMHSFLSVAKGSDQAAKLIVVKYQGTDESQPPHVLIGKGLTFDSGGISLKPGARMEEMKYDMGGAAAVIGTMNTIAELQPNTNIVAIIAAAENMPSARASKPGDVVTSMSGKTIEIINTDAEGRLVLCDAMTYAERFNPATVVDIATLTGAVIAGLGMHPTAVYANDDTLSQDLLEAGTEAWDRGWPMPLWQDYEEEITTPFADLRNTGSVAGAGGSITAAMFLKAFADNYKWAHLDIAGVAWQGGKNMGSTGRPVPMLTHYLLGCDK
ncbi:MAG: leucyl aminopeptidase [Psychromonas sp.]|nr:leucyl aminopeptidase [Alteromonadales bacterium]MCP5077290.1 leucyl aminopeptidase [Psychromonas sp.]